MYNETIDYLKRAIKRTYKRYIGERTDGKATIADVADFFNIQLDESRLEDYSVKEIDYSIPYIQIIDEKTNNSYYAGYTRCADLLNYSGPTQFINVITKGPIRNEETLYRIGDKSPIITRMTFVNGDNELVFEKEMPNSVSLFIHEGITMRVRYLQNMIYNGKQVKQRLLNKICNISNEDFFEQMYTYGISNYIKYNDTQDKYTHIKDKNIIYGIEKQEEPTIYLCGGICFENKGREIENYLPTRIKLEHYPKLGDKNVISAMVFSARTDDRVSHSLQIYKEKDITNIMYSAKKCYYEKGFHEELVCDKEYSLTNLNDGTITSKEIENILTSLQPILESNVFETISNELNMFAKKINIRNGLIQEELDLLSPKLLINKSFDEIFALVSSNKDEYFKLISEQFEALAHINKDEVKVHTKALK